ncbi:hypothetical protein ACFL2Z_03345 [Candidatus Eisenbacteria bacterium]|uniref:Abnormal spindle-like microcephaly-associated protein ASH domain-containing protein n=1 Tax=Eiseniibacteriota bacterium TaxID=2212470 RepID=A0ABV6YPU3_UNCEI
MNRAFRLLSYAVLVCALLLCTCSGDCPPCQCDLPCVVSADSLSFGDVPVGEFSDLTFVIENPCGSAIAGAVSGICGDFSVVGDTLYDLNAGESAEFTVRFSPTREGTHTCVLETGSSECPALPCSGEAARRVVFSDGFEDGNRDGWLDQKICSQAYSYSYSVVYSSQDTSMVLKHEGGVASGGGNGEAYVADGVELSDVEITADIRNVTAYHPTAKAVGLTACLDKSTGVQYLAWYTVAGDLWLYETIAWQLCAPNLLEQVVTNSIEPGEDIQLKMKVKDGLISVWLNGWKVLSHDDSASPLPAGTAGVVATSGVTYFDNIVITTGSL